MRTVAVFLGDRLLAQGKTHLDGLQSDRGTEFEASGFRFDLPKQELESLAEVGLTVVAMTEDGAAKVLDGIFLPSEVVDGQTFLPVSNGKRYRVVEDAVMGFLDRWELPGQSVWEIDGWAAVTESGRVAEMVAVYRDGEPIRQDPVIHEREDVAIAFARPELSQSGFKLQFPYAWREEVAAGKIKVYGLSHTNLASELMLVTGDG